MCMNATVVLNDFSCRGAVHWLLRQVRLVCEPPSEISIPHPLQTASITPDRPYASLLPTTSVTVSGNRASAPQHQRQQLPTHGVNIGGAIAVRVQRAADRTGIPTAPAQAANAMSTASSVKMVAHLGSSGGGGDGSGATGIDDTAEMCTSGVRHESWTGRPNIAGVQSNDQEGGRGGWFDSPRPDASSNDFHDTKAWINSWRDVEFEQPGGTTESQPTMAPIRPATPPTMQRLEIRAAAGAEVGGISGGVAGGGGGRGENYDRYFNREGEGSIVSGGDGLPAGEDSVGREGAEKGTVAVNIAKRLDFHDVFS